MSSPNHTRANVRVKFPDGYLLQGTFGAKEQIKDIYNFVQENLYSKDRQFYLYESPPKREFDQKTMNLTLIQAKLVPSCMIYFAWKDKSETKPEDGPFLDMKNLRDYMVNI